MAEIDNTEFYTFLGVEKTASPAEFKRAYFLKARLYHPDKNPDDPEAERKFKEISEAYQVLSDPEKKEIYDKYGKSALSETGVIDPTMIFRLLFGGPNFEDLIGDMSLGVVVALSMQERPEGRSDEEHEAWIAEEVGKLTKVRVAALVHRLLIRIEPLVHGVDVMEAIQADVAQKLESPGGGSLLSHIGYVYESESRKKVKSFLGLGGVAASLRQKAHQFGQMWSLAKSAVQLGSASSRLESISADSEGTEIDETQHEERAQLEDKLKRHGMSTMWKVGLIEIENITREVCHTILHDDSVTSELRQQRAHAIGKIGAIYQKLSKKHVKRSADILADLESSLGDTPASSSAASSPSTSYSASAASSSSSTQKTATVADSNSAPPLVPTRLIDDSPPPIIAPFQGSEPPATVSEPTAATTNEPIKLGDAPAKRPSDFETLHKSVQAD